MLNISPKRVIENIDLQNIKAFKEVGSSKLNEKVIYVLLALLFTFIVILFLPWTQNVQGTGKIISLDPTKQAQTIHSAITGRIQQWYKREGELVEAGDTVVFISEVKSEYLDPELINRTKFQINAKKQKVKSYEEKITALDQQIQMLTANRELKLEQTQNKLRQANLKMFSDSINFEVERQNFDVAVRQLDGGKNMYKTGVKSLVDYEKVKVKFQEARNKLVKAENDWIYSKNEVINARIDLNSVVNEYNEKIAKSRSDQYSAQSLMFEAQAELNKLQNQLTNYAQRAGFYYITAPQRGYITKASQSGLGEVVKEGKSVFSFVPANTDLAVELYIEPIDLPLIREGNKARLIFDGWPAMVFAGWPGLTSGTFSGEVSAFDKTISPNGKFRILVVPDITDTSGEWPDQLRLGTGAYGIALLNTVPVWYEIWRQLNTFPPDFYKEKAELEDEKKAEKDGDKPKKDPIKRPKSKF